jgi:hypothetical protein
MAHLVVKPTAADGGEPELGALVRALGSAQTGDRAARDLAIEHLDRWLARGYEPPLPAAEEARLIASARWLLNDRPDHPVIPVWAARALPVLHELDDRALSALLASFFFEYSIRIGDFASAGGLVAEIWDRTASDWSARVTWLPSAALYLWLSGRSEAALAALAPALDDASLAPRMRYELLEQAASAALAGGDIKRCRDYLALADPLLTHLSQQERAHIWFLRAGAAAMANEIESAVEAMARCEDVGRDVDARFFNALWRLGAALVRLGADQPRHAERDLSNLLGDVVLMRARYLEWSVRLARATARFALSRRPAAEADLAAALRVAGENGYVNCDPWGLMPAQRSLLAFAVERGIEARTARAILAHHGS